ncbi:hypothetical protein GWK47_022884 [Chionoecetes opilio]|uniref:Uncharacterized protein n=1 Tax=Chionoecetes opilio TaxID=41210 RepID=A0A8J5CJZ2_CHIOP|nr:hypothetical protein GWK47_022884 [Chionoecetes opilio]
MVVMFVADLLKPLTNPEIFKSNFIWRKKGVRGRKGLHPKPPLHPGKTSSRRPANRSATETLPDRLPIIQHRGSHLPPNKRAFQYFLHLQSFPENTGNPKHQDLANKSGGYIPFWQMARIKTMKRQAAQLFFQGHLQKAQRLARKKGLERCPWGKRGPFVELDSLLT